MKNAAIAAAVAVGALAGAVAYVAYDQLQSRMAPASMPAPASPAAPAGQLVATLPQFQLADRAGEMRSLQDWPDKALIVNFWATWCAPCRREIPLLVKLQQDHGPEGFQVIGIAVDFRDKVLAYADEMKIDYPILIEGDQYPLSEAFDIFATPTVYVIRQDGAIAYTTMGFLRVQMEELSREVASVLGSEYQPIIQEEMDEAIPLFVPG